MATLRFVGLADGSSSPVDGCYLVEYDPTRDGGRRSVFENAHLIVSPAYDDALHLPLPEMLKLWRRVDPRDPWRPDGKPNRPLTAFTVEITK